MWNKSRWTDIRKPWLPQPCLALWVSNLVRRSHFCVPFLHPPPFWSPSPQAWAEETNSHHPPLERFLAPTLFLVFTPKLCYIPGESGSPLWSQTGRSSQWLWPQLRIQCSGSQEPGKGTQEVGCCGLLGIIFYLDTRRPCCSLASSSRQLYLSSVLFSQRLLQEQTHSEGRQLVRSTSSETHSGSSRHLSWSLQLQPHCWEMSDFINTFFGKF